MMPMNKGIVVCSISIPCLLHCCWYIQLLKPLLLMALEGDNVVVPGCTQNRILNGPSCEQQLLAFRMPLVRLTA